MDLRVLYAPACEVAVHFVQDRYGRDAYSVHMIAPMKSATLLAMLAGTAVLAQSQEEAERAATQAANRSVVVC